MHIIEFGPLVIFARTHPALTRWIFAGTSIANPPSPVGAFGYRSFVDLFRLLGSSDNAFVACHVPGVMPRFGWMEAGYGLILQKSRIPVVGLDFNDDVPLTPMALRVLDRCAVYFKRELPLDRAELALHGSAKAAAVVERNLGKFRPVSVGLADWRLTGGPSAPLGRDTDIFFAGNVNIGPRLREAALLAPLKGEGIKLDFTFDRIDRTEYLRRMARAHLGWSPEGIGWQCIRHFEAAAMGSVPVIGRPRIELPEPLRHGEHCFYYGPDEDDLLHVIRSALADKERLRRMGEAARRHVMRHHTHGATVGGMLAGISEVLGRDPLQGGPGRA
jgi:glycosyltransferase involved in cell wall biosynthesis